MPENQPIEPLEPMNNNPSGKSRLNGDATFCDSPMRGFGLGSRFTGEIQDYGNAVQFSANFGVNWTMDRGFSINVGGGFRFAVPGDQVLSYSLLGYNWNQETGGSFACGLTYTNGGGRISGGASNGAISPNITIGLNLGPVLTGGVIVDPRRIPLVFPH